MRKIFFAIFLGASSCLTAQTLVELNPVTITASKAPQKTNETGRNITVIDGRLMQQLPVHAIDELLKYIPGVEVQARGPMGAQADIVLRGGTFQQVLVLLDGIKLNDPISGHLSSYIPITPFEIDRIEILRGPAATVYGAEAVGGVINIVTKNFSRFDKKNELKGAAALALGEFDLHKTSAGIRKTGEKINFSAGVLNNSTKGQFLRGENRGFANNQTYTMSGVLPLKNNWQLAARTSYDRRDFAAQNFYTNLVSDTATEKVNTWWNQLQLKQQKEKYTNQFDVVFKRTRDQYLFNPSSIANDNRSGNLMVQYLRTQKIGRLMNLSAGTNLGRRSITSNDRGNHTTHHAAIFGSLLYSKSHWRLSPSLRLEQDENFGLAFLPQFNSSYQLNNITFRATAGRAIRSADFTERFNNFNKPSVKSGSIGNPDLQAEKSWSYEAGADISVADNFKASVTGFYRNQNNVIDYVTTPYVDMPRKDNLVTGSVYALAKNLKKVKTRGIEMELVYQRLLAEKQSLYFNAGLTILSSKSNDATPSYYIISHAHSLLQGTLIYNYGKFGLSANMLYKSRGALAATAINADISTSYFLLNGQCTYTVAAYAKLFIAVNNITDKKYSDLLGSIMPERWTTAGFNFTF